MHLNTNIRYTPNKVGRNKMGGGANIEKNTMKNQIAQFCKCYLKWKPTSINDQRYLPTVILFY